MTTLNRQIDNKQTDRQTDNAQHQTNQQKWKQTSFDRSKNLKDMYWSRELHSNNGTMALLTLDFHAWQANNNKLSQRSSCSTLIVWTLLGFFSMTKFHKRRPTIIWKINNSYSWKVVLQAATAVISLLWTVIMSLNRLAIRAWVNHAYLSTAGETPFTICHSENTS